MTAPAAARAERYLTVPAAAHFMRETLGLPVTDRQVRGWADRGDLPFFQGPGRERLICQESLRRWFAERQAAAERPPPRLRRVGL